MGTTAEGFGRLPETDSSVDQPIGNPVMLVQADTSREGKVGTDPNEDATPLGVIDVEVILIDPSLFQFQMPAVFLFASDCLHNARWFSRLQNADHLIRLGRFEIRLHKLIAPAFGRIQNRGSPFLGAVDDPVVELCRNLAQHIPADGIEISIRAKETNHALLLLKRLDESIEEDAIETSVLKSDVILVMLVESVHRISFQLSQTEG